MKYNTPADMIYLDDNSQATKGRRANRCIRATERKKGKEKKSRLRRTPDQLKCLGKKKLLFPFLLLTSRLIVWGFFRLQPLSLAAHPSHICRARAPSTLPCFACHCYARAASVAKLVLLGLLSAAPNLVS
uniref:Uncharacterized protein n=1 Tax=Arundo donax TaxID=35708 RepID=A0A0A9DMM2_ARUDO